MNVLSSEELVTALDLLEAITYGKIKDNIIYDLSSNPIIEIAANSQKRRELKLITDKRNPESQRYKSVFDKLIINEKDI